MHIYTTTPRLMERAVSGAGGSTYETANRVGSHPADSLIGSRLSGVGSETARHAALSALRNDRFGTMLASISDPRSSEKMMLMGRDTAQPAASFNFVQSSYAENSE